MAYILDNWDTKMISFDLLFQYELGTKPIKSANNNLQNSVWYSVTTATRTNANHLIIIIERSILWKHSAVLNNGVVLINITTFYKNIERHTAQTIVSWPNPKQWNDIHKASKCVL